MRWRWSALCIDLLVPTVCQLIQYYVKHAYQVIPLIVARLELQVLQVKRKLVELQVELGDVVRIIHLGPESPLAPRLEYAMMPVLIGVGRMEYTFNDPIYAIY
jgi:hypothetical protein